MSSLLTVIVPVYNVEKYLTECIDSIVNQTYKNLEIFLIDDGSTDKSGTICDEYAVKDCRIKVIHQKNQGQSAARNTALKICTGDYITLVDSDDYIVLEAFELCMRIVKKNNLDCLMFNAYTGTNFPKGSDKLVIDDIDNIMRECLLDNITVAWGKIIKRDVWEGIFYPVGRVYEDCAISYDIFRKIKKIGHIDKELYYYRKNPTGTCSSAIFNPKSRYDYILTCVEKLNHAIELGICVDDCRANLIKAVLSYLTSFYGMNYDRDTCYYEAVTILRDNIRLPYNRNRLNPKYKIFLWSFENCNTIHKIGAKLSMMSKKLKY